MNLTSADVNGVPSDQVTPSWRVQVSVKKILAVFPGRCQPRLNDTLHHAVDGQRLVDAGLGGPARGVIRNERIEVLGERCQLLLGDRGQLQVTLLRGGGD